MDELKLCNSCNNKKEYIEFHLNITRRDGRSNRCIQCTQEYQRKHYLKNKEKRTKEILEWRSNNKEKYDESQRVYRERERDYINEYRRDWAKNKQATDIQYSLNHRMRSGIDRSLKNGKQWKSWKDFVEYSFDDLLTHLKTKLINGMTWGDYLSGKLHIDHIRPLASFNFEDENDSEFKECWALENLQFLWEEDNKKKLDKWDGTSDNRSFNLSYISYDELVKNLNK
jgi:hypothetical protein